MDFLRLPNKAKYWLASEEERCAICGEPLSGEIAEMYNPDESYYDEEVGGDNEGTVHAECGLQRGWKVSYVTTAEDKTKTSDDKDKKVDWELWNPKSKGWRKKKDALEFTRKIKDPQTGREFKIRVDFEHPFGLAPLVMVGGDYPQGFELGGTPKTFEDLDEKLEEIDYVTKLYIDGDISEEDLTKLGTQATAVRRLDRLEEKLEKAQDIVSNWDDHVEEEIRRQKDRDTSGSWGRKSPEEMASEKYQKRVKLEAERSLVLQLQNAVGLAEKEPGYTTIPSYHPLGERPYRGEEDIPTVIEAYKKNRTLLLEKLKDGSFESNPFVGPGGKLRSFRDTLEQMPSYQESKKKKNDEDGSDSSDSEPEAGSRVKGKDKDGNEYEGELVKMIFGRPKIKTDDGEEVMLTDYEKA